MDKIVKQVNYYEIQRLKFMAGMFQKPTLVPNFFMHFTS